MGHHIYIYILSWWAGYPSAQQGFFSVFIIVHPPKVRSPRQSHWDCICNCDLRSHQIPGQPVIPRKSKQLKQLKQLTAGELRKEHFQLEKGASLVRHSPYSSTFASTLSTQNKCQAKPKQINGAASGHCFMVTCQVANSCPDVGYVGQANHLPHLSFEVRLIERLAREGVLRHLTD